MEGDVPFVGFDTRVTGVHLRMVWLLCLKVSRIVNRGEVFRPRAKEGTFETRAIVFRSLGRRVSNRP
jgi:hypothetical protein